MSAYATDAWSQVFEGPQSRREMSSFLLSKSSVTPQKHLVFIPYTAITQTAPVGSGDIPRTSFTGCSAVAQSLSLGCVFPCL